MGKTIMVSSHILPELADICNKIGIIERGELLVNADVADVMKQVRRQTILEHRRGRRSATARPSCCDDHPSVEKVEPRGDVLIVTLRRRARPTTATCPRC